MKIVIHHLYTYKIY